MTRYANSHNCIIHLFIFASLAIFVPISSSRAEVPQWAKGTWPAISTSVTTTDKWIVIRGMTLGGVENRVIWETPLLERGPSVAVQHGTSTTFVQAGHRQFVVDNATGQAIELRGGAVYRRIDPRGGQLAYPQNSQGPSAEPAPADRGQYQPEDGVEFAQAPITQQAASGDPAVRQLQAYQRSLRELMIANEDLLEAMLRMDRVRQLQDAGRATADDVRAAELQVQQRQTKASDIQKQVDRLGHPTQPAQRPANGEIDMPALNPLQMEQVQKAQERVLYLNELINEEGVKLQQYQEAGMDANAPAAIAARRNIRRYEQALEQAKMDLAELNRSFEGQEKKPVSPELRSRVGQAERTVLDMAEQVRQDEQRLRQVRQKGDKASDDELAEASNRLVCSIRKLSSARAELDELNQMVYGAPARTEAGSATQPPPATQPSP